MNEIKILLIHGINHKGSTYHIARTLADQISDQVQEVFLPKDFGSMCIGCGQCILKDEKMCPHYQELAHLTKAMDEADVLILDSPVYTYHVTSGMKAFLEHYGWCWMLHRPMESMFQKQMVCIATAAGAGQKSTCQDMADSATYWGVGKIYKYGLVVRAMKWEDVGQDKKEQIEGDMTRLAGKIKTRAGKIKPSIKTRFLFFVMGQIVKKRKDSADYAYWEEKGWLGKKRPWS